MNILFIFWEKNSSVVHTYTIYFLYRDEKVTNTIFFFIQKKKTNTFFLIKLIV